MRETSRYRCTWRREFLGSDPGKVFRTRARTEQLVTPRLTAVANELKRPLIGLRLANELQPDVIITDALLPKLDGRELARSVKMNPDTSHCRVAVMTALYKGLRYRREAMTHFQADEYLEKPISPAKLLAVTERLLNQTFGDQIHDYAGVEAHAQ